MQNKNEVARLGRVAVIVSAIASLLGGVSARASGQGGVGVLSLSPAQLNFGDVLITSATGGGPSAPQTVTVTNTGGAALTITTIALSSHFFSETDTCRTSPSGTGPSIAPGGSCTISVVFQPVTCGAVAATLTVTSDSASNSPQTVSLSGTGTGPCATLSASVLTFPGQLVTTTSAPQTVTLTSTGSQPVVILSITVEGVFTQTNTCTTAPIAPGATCTVSVTFTPVQGGATPGFVQINDNTGPIGQVISLGGTGSDFSLSASPTSNTVSAGGSASYTVTVAPTGGFNQAVSLACVSPPPGVSCSFSPGSVTPNGSSSATSTVTVSTTASGFTLPGEFKPPFPRGGSGHRIFLWGLLAALLALAAAPRPFRNQPGHSPQPTARAIIVVALLLAALAVPACGGGSSSTTVSTPAGSYQVLVNGSASAGSATVTNPTTLILVVQ